MTVNRKPTGIAHWAVRVMAISLALLLFSVIGVVAILTVAHANGLVGTIVTDTPVVPTAAPTDPPTAVPTNPPKPTAVPTNPPKPTAVPTAAPTQAPTAAPTQAPIPTAAPTAPDGGITPVVGATPTSIGIGGGNAKPTATTQKGTPTAQASTGTPPVGGQGMPTNTSSNTHAADNGIMTTITSFTGPIIGASSIVVLSTTGLIGLAVWKRRKTNLAQEARGAVAPQLHASPVQAQEPWIDRLEVAPPSGSYYTQPTEHASTSYPANPMMVPFALQGIAQYSPLLGAPNSSLLDAPATLPTSDLRPLPIDYPHIIETTTGKELRHTPPPTMQVTPPDREIGYHQSHSAPMRPWLTPPQARSSSIEEIPTTPPALSAAYQESQSDPFMEAMMHQAQMGIFALPGKDG